jgi:hypothetical protein
LLLHCKHLSSSKKFIFGKIPKVLHIIHIGDSAIAASGATIERVSPPFLGCKNRAGAPILHSRFRILDWGRRGGDRILDFGFWIGVDGSAGVDRVADWRTRGRFLALAGTKNGMVLAAVFTIKK